MAKPDGGPAFPFPDAQGPGPYALTGLSLRDYFAAQALNGVVAIEYSKSWTGGPTLTDEQLALRCYVVADAMLAEREK